MPSGQVHGNFCRELATKGLSLAARGLLLHLLDLADSKGRIKADEPPLSNDVELINALYGGAQLFDVTADRRTADRTQLGLLMDELAAACEVIRYEANGRRFMLLPRVVTRGARGNLKAQRSVITPPPMALLTAMQFSAKEAAELIDSAPWRDGESKTVAAKRVMEHDTVLAVFEYWARAMGKDTRRTKLDGPRRGVIRRALRTGYTIEDLKHAIDGCRADKWCMGANDQQRKYNDLTHILRDGERLERYRDAWLRGKGTCGGMVEGTGALPGGDDVFSAAMQEESQRRGNVDGE